MSRVEQSSSVVSRATAMRRSFDGAFALPVGDAVEASADFLAVRIGGDAYAIRLSEIAGLHVDLNVVPVPGPAPHLLGIAAIRGAMAPLYSLAGLLGYPQAANARWIAIIKTPHFLGLAIDAVEAHARVADSQQQFNDRADGPRARRHVLGAVQAAGAIRPILHISQLIQSITGENL